MKLFNEYQNQIFLYLNNYINSCFTDPDSALPEEDFRETLDKLLLNASESIADALINRSIDEDVDSLNANLFFKDSKGRIQPLITNNVPILTSLAERTWLAYILSDPKAGLFLDPTVIEALKANIHIPGANPLSDDTIDVRYPSGRKPRPYSEDEVTCFRIILEAIIEHRYISFTNSSQSGIVYRNENVVPIRFEYNVPSDSFSVSIWNVNEKRPVKMLFENISNPSVGDKIKDYDSIKTEYEKALLSRRVETPVKLIIQDHNNGFDRASFVLSAYDRVSYRTEDNTINMELYYYSFQENDLINDLLFLGQTVKISSPDCIKEKYISRVKNSLSNYK